MRIITDNERGNAKRKSPSDMFRLPTLNIGIFYQVIYWIIRRTIICTTLWRIISRKYFNKEVLEELEGRFNDTRLKDVDNDKTCHDESSSKCWVIHDGFFLNPKDEHPDECGHYDKEDWLEGHEKQFNEEDIIVVSFC